MDLLFSVIIFILGLVVGSFLNCVIYRLEEGESFMKGRSYCPHCKHVLAPWDLVPVFSFLLLLGKCRYCKKKISIQYPIVELATGLLFFLIFNYQFQISQEFLNPNFHLGALLYYLILSSLLVIIFVFDLKHFIIPDAVLFPAIAFSLAFNVSLWLSGKISAHEFLGMVLSALFTSLFFYFVYWVTKEQGIGFGDVKFGILLGLVAGWPRILVALFSAFSIGAILGIGLIIGGRKTLKSEIPFGPFLIIGLFVALFWGNTIVNWYLSLLL